MDERYFASCAARGLAVGHVPVAGCHDNKGPVIFLVHQIVQMASARYNLLAIKLAAYGVAMLVIALTARLAYWLGGRLAAVIAAALALQSLATDATHLALKTETIGIAFVLVGLIVIVPGSPGGRYARLLIGGCFVGLALVTKQTNLLVGLTVLIWLGLSLRGRTGGWLRVFLKEAACFSTGLLTPFFAFTAVFLGSGQGVEFLSSFFVYPAVYGSSNGALFSPFKVFAWKVGEVLKTFANTPLLVTLFVASAVAPVDLVSGNDARSCGVRLSRLLVYLVALSLAAAILVSPIFYPNHVVPVMVVMAVTSGVLFADAASGWMASNPRAIATFGAVVLVSSILTTASSWRGNGGKQSALLAIDPRPLIERDEGQYAYVVGMWPNFYIEHGLIPASNVMFPWALLGAPPNHLYTLSPPKSLRGRLLSWARARATSELISDFSRTPPRYIVVVDRLARSPNSLRIVDVPEIDAYLQGRCHRLSDVQTGNHGKGSIFRCRIDVQGNQAVPAATLP